jgi:hypothetical protein
MSKISGFNFNEDGKFNVPAAMFRKKDVPEQIAPVMVNQVTAVRIARDMNQHANGLSNKLQKVSNHVSLLEIDKDTDTVMMDKEFVTKLVKLVEQCKTDFAKMIKAAQSI